ncbi:MAG: outer membrane beta-barrel protein [Bacteroidota bacterium]
MKNLVLLILSMTLLSTQLTFGQERSQTDFARKFNFGVRAGGNLSTILYNDGADQCAAELFGIISSETYVPRYFIGGHTDFRFRDNMSITLGVQYVFKGGGEEFTMPDPANPSQRISGTIDNRISYLQVPLQFNFKLKNYSIGVGGYWAYVLSGEQVWDLEGSEEQAIDMNFGETAEDHMKNTDLGLNLELGYWISDDLQVFAHFQQGLTPQMSDANRETFKSLGYDYRFYHRAYGIGLTFFIPRKG